MKNRAGWKPTFTPPLADALCFLTQRMDSVCELTTPVYGSAATVSRVFCFGGIATKSNPVSDFTGMTRVESAC